MKRGNKNHQHPVRPFLVLSDLSSFHSRHPSVASGRTIQKGRRNIGILRRFGVLGCFLVPVVFGRWVGSLIGLAQVDGQWHTCTHLLRSFDDTTNMQTYGHRGSANTVAPLPRFKVGEKSNQVGAGCFW